MTYQVTKLKYRATIGIECHVQLKTKTKLFSPAGNDARGAAPNTLISPLCLGLPGALPVLNEWAVELAMRAAFALNTEPQKYSYFERKHYFYPDLPTGYQITQLESPIIVGGSVVTYVNGEIKTVAVHRVQLEADAGKSFHPAGKDYSLVDLNRVGTPLLEIVSEPDMHSPAEAKAYAHELWLLMRYADVSDCDLFHGNMRFDVNVSVSVDATLGTRTETKNLNSFRSVEKAAEYEIKRQINLLEKGTPIVQETRGWEDAAQKTFSQRGKEDAHDYRYFPEPDIPPITLSENKIASAEAAMPVLPAALRSQLITLGLDISAVETLIEEIPAGRFMMEIIKTADKTRSKRIAGWLTSDVQALVAAKTTTWEMANLDMASFLQLAELSQNNKISSTAAKQILGEMVTAGGDPLAIAQNKNLLQVSNESEIDKIVTQVLTDNPKTAQDIAKGETKAIGYLVGQVMKLSKGTANPELAQKLIRQKLG